MPYSVQYRPVASGKDWAKVNRRTGRVVSRHRSKALAEASIKAYYLNRNAALPLPYLVLHARPRPKRLDPTRTTLLRQQFAVEVRRRWGEVQTAVRRFVGELDSLGLSPSPGPFVFLAEDSTRRKYAFLSEPDKLAAFNQWFKEQVDNRVLSTVGETTPGEPWSTKYVSSAYKRGQFNAYLASRKAKGIDIPDEMQEAFLRDSFLTDEAQAKIRLLGTRAWEDMKGIGAQTGAEMNRILAQGMADGLNPWAVARNLTDRIDTFSKHRSLLVARTEMIHAHAEGQLDTYTDLGVEELQIEAEFSTAGDDRVCPQCESLEGKTYAVKDAHGIIPVHPNCRCSWLPKVPTGEETAAKKGTPLAETGTAKAAGPQIVIRKSAEQYRQELLAEAQRRQAASVLSVEEQATLQRLEEQRRSLMLQQANSLAERQAVWTQARAAGRAELLPDEKQLYQAAVEKFNAAVKTQAETQAKITGLESKVRAGRMSRAQSLEFLAEKDNLASLTAAELKHVPKEYGDALRDMLKIMPKDAFSPSTADAFFDFRFQRKLLSGKAGEYSKLTKTVTLNSKLGREGRRVAVHEWGHHISYQSRSIMNAQTALFEARTKGEAVARLPGFRSGIVGKKDKWGDAWHYAGRVYSDGRTPEIIAVGMERLFLNPLEFAKNDPEWFNMILGALKGF